MEDLIQKLTALMIRQFPGSELELETSNPDRLSGLLTLTPEEMTAARAG